MINDKHIHTKAGNKHSHRHNDKRYTRQTHAYISIYIKTNFFSAPQITPYTKTHDLLTRTKAGNNHSPNNRRYTRYTRIESNDIWENDFPHINAHIPYQCRPRKEFPISVAYEQEINIPRRETLHFARYMCVLKRWIRRGLHIFALFAIKIPFPCL